VSDDYIRLIPTDKQWQPSPEGAAAATSYVAGLFSGPEDDVEEVEAEFYDQVTLIEAGENTTRISCSNCDGDIEVHWFLQLIEENGESFASLDIQVPCCGAVVALDFAALRLAGRVCPIRAVRHESDSNQVPARRHRNRRSGRTSRSPCHADPCALLTAGQACGSAAERALLKVKGLTPKRKGPSGQDGAPHREWWWWLGLGHVRVCGFIGDVGQFAP
jgi:hypothetical protein